MSSERAILIALAVVVATSIAIALLLADGATWPAALLGRLTAGGAALWGLLGWLTRHREP